MDTAPIASRVDRQDAAIPSWRTFVERIDRRAGSRQVGLQRLQQLGGHRGGRRVVLQASAVCSQLDTVRLHHCQ